MYEMKKINDCISAIYKNGKEIESLEELVQDLNNLNNGHSYSVKYDGDLNFVLEDGKIMFPENSIKKLNGVDNMEKKCKNCKNLTMVSLYYDDGKGLKPYDDTEWCSHMDDFTKPNAWCDEWESNE